MSNEIIPFPHEEFGEVRTTIINGEPWFIARDIAKALGYEDPADAIQRHCKKSNDFNMGVSPNVPSPKIIPESDVYRLIMRSKLPSAERFQDWVCEEVLPSIRKTGSYSMVMPQDFPTALRMYANEVEQRMLMEKQRDEALRTKAEIGSRREATAMNRAAQEVKKSNRLETELKCRSQWKALNTPYNIPWIKDFFANSRGLKDALDRKLESISEEMGFDVLKVESSQYGQASAYHVFVVEKLRERLIADNNMLGKYRLGW